MITLNKNIITQSHRFRDLKALLLAGFIFLLAFLYGFNYGIHTSEFWSIYVSKYFFNIDFYETIGAKPVFYFLLWLIHLIPLDNAQHLIVVKIIFSILGAIQLCLAYGILQSLFKFQYRHILSVALLIYMLAVDAYLENFFRVRADQLLVTVFLLYIYLRAKTHLTRRSIIAFQLAFLLISVKGIFFVILAFLKDYKYIIFFNFKDKFNRFVFAASFLLLIICYLLLNWSSFVYYLDGFNYVAESISLYKQWVVQIGLFILLYLVYLYFKLKNRITESENSLSIKYLPVIFIYVWCIPQKYNFFLASLTPVLLVMGSSALSNLIKNNLISKKLIVFLIAFCLFLNLIELKKIYQIKFFQAQIAFVKDFEVYVKALNIEKNNLKYVDGFAVLPREKNNLNCFVSPNDYLANQFCESLIFQKKADIIFYSPRLRQLVKEETIDLNYYNKINDFIYLSKAIRSNPKIDLKNSPYFVFGFER